MNHRHQPPPLPADFPLEPGIRARFLEGINGLTVHVLEAGFETPNRPAILPLHGFPDLAYCWRKVLVPLAAAGYHVVAPDQRGYGQTTGWDNHYEGDVSSFRNHSYARDAFGVMQALGHREVACIVGHDFGAAVAAYCVLTRPDYFRSLVLMSYPFDGVPAVAAGVGPGPRPAQRPRSSWPTSRARAKTAWRISLRGKPTTTCCTASRACVIFCARISS